MKLCRRMRYALGKWDFGADLDQVVDKDLFLHFDQFFWVYFMDLDK